MTQTFRIFRPATSFKKFFNRATRVLFLVVVFWAGISTPVFAQEDAYLRAFALVQQGDSLADAGKKDAAVQKYQQAQTALREFQKSYPNSNKSAVSFRLNYVGQKIATLTKATTAPEAESPAVRESRSETKAAAGAVDSSLRFKLLDAGAEPRKMLRLTAKAGDKQSVTMALGVSMTTKMGDAAMPAMKLPAINMVVDSTVTGVSAEGDVSYEMVISDTTVTEETGTMAGTAELMKASLAGMKGTKVSGTVSSRGISKSVDLKAPSTDSQTKQVVEQMRDSFSRMGVPLPDEAVGVGARWEASAPLKSQGMTIDQTATYQIVSIEGDRIKTKCTIAQHASNQKIQSAAMPGLTLDLIKMTGSGMGAITCDVSQVLPPRAAFDEHTDMSMGMNVGGKKQAMTIVMDTSVHLDAK